MLFWLIVFIFCVIIFIWVKSMDPYKSSKSKTYDEIRPLPKGYVPQQAESISSGSSRRPRISSEVSDSFYDEIQSFCARNTMTVSDLIRKSVKVYIDNN